MAPSIEAAERRAPQGPAAARPPAKRPRRHTLYKALSHPLRLAILAQFDDEDREELAPSDLQRLLPKAIDTASLTYHLTGLVKAGIAEASREEVVPGTGAVKHFYVLTKLGRAVKQLESRLWVSLKEEAI